jgi:hypothetical protein
LQRTWSSLTLGTTPLNASIVSRTWPPIKPFEEVAIAFASALVEGNFAAAHALLSSSLKETVSSVSLRDAFLRMVRLYEPEKPTSIHFADFSMETWPAKQSGDVGWAYVSICGDSFVEAVTVVVSDLDGSLLIRDIEWGRP